jgi:hypothetical protein
MPYFKCVACKTRLFRAAGSADLVGDLCPACGSLLEPVGELAELVGFQSIKSRGTPAEASIGGLQRLADRVGEIRTRREAHEAQTPLDASAGPMTAAASPPKQSPKRWPLPKPRTDL